MSEVKLKPCPFCGGKATLRKSEVTQLYHVACFECGCRQDSSYKSESAVNAWNTRKPMDDIVERLEEELKLADEEKERCSRGNHLMFDSAKSYATGISNAIEIIKGGVED